MESKTLVEVHLGNFQIHRNLEISFGPGITLISGPNSSGKTSLFRGIRAPLLNSSRSRQWITHGEKKMEVRLVVLGRELKWTRTAKEATYEIDGEPYTKLGRSKVWDFAPDYPLGLGTKGETLNFQTEWDLLFPFDRNPPEMYSLLEEIFDLGDFKEAFGQVRGDIKEAKAEAERALIPLNEAREWIDDFLNLPELSRVEEEVEQYIEKCDRVAALEKESDYLEGVAPLVEAEIPSNWSDPVVWEVLFLSAPLGEIEKEIPDPAKFEEECFDEILELLSIIRKSRKEIPDSAGFVVDQFDGILEIKAKMAEIRNLGDELKPLEEERDRLIDLLGKRFPDCPLCGKPTTEEDHGH